ncbi:uncharacterized protein LAJ45_00495 [Morchella importuna]|uniref:uncharacterized protein n=1 Tax=Morchella importuna TaxID=1174673 RepID=UPI001E8DEF08|nr:uncharacterized protein LAJ45_00495 [Morchella importuna]KAH8155485.1 hypothetical protein LAJ45_00495 [Morchella importuna]
MVPQIRITLFLCSGNRYAFLRQFPLKCLGQGYLSIHDCGVAVEQEQPDISDKEFDIFKNPPTTTVVLKHC